MSDDNTPQDGPEPIRDEAQPSTGPDSAQTDATSDAEQEQHEGCTLPIELTTVMLFPIASVARRTDPVAGTYPHGQPTLDVHVVHRLLSLDEDLGVRLIPRATTQGPDQDQDDLARLEARQNHARLCLDLLEDILALSRTGPDDSPSYQARIRPLRRLSDAVDAAARLDRLDIPTALDARHVAFGPVVAATWYDAVVDLGRLVLQTAAQVDGPTQLARLDVPRLSVLRGKLEEEYAGARRAAWGLTMQSGPPSAASRFRFAKVGERIQIRFREECGEFKSLDGFEYVRVLLSQPYIPIEALELTGDPVALAGSRSVVTPQEVGGAPRPARAYKRLDREAIETVVAARARAEALARDAAAAGNTEEAENHCNQVAFLTRYLEEGRGPGGRPRKLGADPSDRAAQRVRKSLDYAYSALRKAKPPMVLLELHLKGGSSCENKAFCYAPKDCLPDWET